MHKIHQLDLDGSRRKRNNRGQAILESAMVLLAVLAMIVFILDMGRILLIQQYITERARSTVRAAAVNNWTSAQAANYLVYNSTTAPSGSAGFLGLLPSQVTYTVLGSADSPDYRVQVRVSGVPMITWIPFMAGTYTSAPVIATTPAQSLGATN